MVYPGDRDILACEIESKADFRRYDAVAAGDGGLQYTPGGGEPAAPPAARPESVAYWSRVTRPRPMVLDGNVNSTGALDIRYFGFKTPIKPSLKGHVQCPS